MRRQTDEHLLRMEGVNLSAVLDDTSQISVRRGAGLMQRQAVKEIDKEFDALTPITLGASAGLFRFTSSDPDALVGRIADHLNRKYSGFTYVVDTAPIEGSFQPAIERVMALNRIRQFQQMTLCPPTEGTDGEVCPMSRLYPAGTHLRKKEKRVSNFVTTRFDYGRENRGEFYDNELGKTLKLEFTNDLDELTQPASGRDYGNLNGKMAVIYLDGNKADFRPLHGRHAVLASDLMEPFRHLVERVALSAVTRGQLKPGDFRDDAQQGCRLTPPALRKYLAMLWERFDPPIPAVGADQPYPVLQQIPPQHRRLPDWIRGGDEFKAWVTR